MDTIESYVIFTDHPRFTPMFNPFQMLEYGIHEGCIFNPDFDGIKLSVEQLTRFRNKTPATYYISPPSRENNYYKVMEEIPPFYQYTGNTPAEGILIDSKNWFAWYTDFYFGKRGPLDTRMMEWWRTVVYWGLYEGPKTSAVDQMLLHYSWNPGFDFKQKKTWQENGSKPSHQ